MHAETFHCYTPECGWQKIGWKAYYEFRRYFEENPEWFEGCKLLHING